MELRVSAESVEPILTAGQDKGRAGKVEGMILGGNSHTGDKSQSWGPTRLHTWCKDKLEKMFCTSRESKKNTHRIWGKERSKE